MSELLRHLLKKLSYNETVNESNPTKKLLRQEAARWMCLFGDSQCYHIAKTMLDNHLENSTNSK